MFWVYIVQNPQGRFYVGQTDALTARVFSHNRTDKTLGKFTRKNDPRTLVWSEEHPTRSPPLELAGWPGEADVGPTAGLPARLTRPLGIGMVRPYSALGALSRPGGRRRNFNRRGGCIDS